MVALSLAVYMNLSIDSGVLCAILKNVLLIRGADRIMGTRNRAVPQGTRGYLQVADKSSQV